VFTPEIDVAGLRKTFVVPVREAGLRAAVRGLVRRRHRQVEAVAGASFSIEAGEVVGFLGPNGAGKTTTLKMLSGLLFPTAGQASVLGHVPWRRERDFLRQIALIMGNRNQLQWDIPALDSYEMYRAIYRIPEAEFRRTRDELVELLDLGDLVRKPVRNLSLGERMKAELIGVLLHRPRVRGFVAEYNRRHGATVLLTSHYMADVLALCRRVIVIHHGRILFDGDLGALAARFSPSKTIGVTLAEPLADPGRYGQVVAADGLRVVLKVDRAEASSVAARLLADHQVTDLTIEDPPIDDVIDRVFTDQVAP